MKPDWRTGYGCELCGEPSATHDVLPDGSPGNAPYMHACGNCVERAKNILQWQEKGSGI